ncbi:CRISPR-associated helicase/endonuclease Cas3 [Clostridium sp. C105KSO13]|uniref:CRISPR-associated helicase/endonuclease Cas3 n=1 Tax=Clostridium sp. C105KSO13 TaxID=1776045 RepID=UPI0007405A6E|nr:CRISPR-associated helicase/endonuclease Cas3 [Clostridium sp. C105KSO13]CUX17768.1 CRISPR-associated nuclease/helicase Cas3 [Clostridium sp. C105KSO13]
MDDSYIAHFVEEDNDFIRIQSVSAHNFNVATLAMSSSPLLNLSSLAWICGILHDAGKYREGFQNYIKRAINHEIVRKGEEDHSSAGGYIINQIFPKTNLSQMVQLAIYSHHGLNDCVSLSKGTIFIEERLNKKENTENVEAVYYQFVDENLLRNKCEEAKCNLIEILDRIKNFMLKNNKKGNLYGNRDFYLGMYERTLLSLLIDADRTDTACFMQNKALPIPKTDEDIQKVWSKSIVHLEEYLKGFKTTSRLDKYRKEISHRCMEAGKSAGRLYRLTVPTGAGKTLSSLRFALYHAKKYHKRHIIYVAPYQSIIDQNAEEIRKAVGDSNIVLEHHCNIIHEEEEERKQYEMLTENWSSPIIVTTAVQFLNTLFARGNGNIRRMYSILNSVIIFDEVQALPVRIMKMYNLAVNFLSELGNSSVVLCSATQPLFDKLDENRMLSPIDMAGAPGEYSDVFRRISIIDATDKSNTGFSTEDLRDFVWERNEQASQILVVVNTKRCAEKIYKELKTQCKETDCLLFHLSTNMCAENRKEILDEISESLKAEKRLICISTQLIEAGVDISFDCVIRSLAGLDSIIQAAGRCNRNGKSDMGYVYIVQMSAEAENVDKLVDIRKAQGSMRKVLYQFKMFPENFENDLVSEKAIKLYYELYLRERIPEMEYLESVNGLPVTLLDLLSSNRKIWNDCTKIEQERRKKFVLRQAFKTAGDLFEVIPEDGKIDIVVRYNNEAGRQIDILESRYSTISERKQALRKLQPYTVGISEQMRQKLGNAVKSICEGAIQVLSENYYSKETGVSEEPEGMEFMNY